MYPKCRSGEQDKKKKKKPAWRQDEGTKTKQPGFTLAHRLSSEREYLTGSEWL